MSFIVAWRIGKRKHKASLWSGDGARLFGGRWNNAGRPVIYTSSTPALAQLEMLAHLENDALQKFYLLARAHIPTKMILDIEDFAKLPKNWRASEAPRTLARIGDAWLLKNASAVLAVPSALSPLDKNYLLNPLHADFAQIRVEKAMAFRFDERLRN